jgi:SWI/SNF-related matrix-associated actin-dependent regulator 1 of chromatin subfamily A
MEISVINDNYAISFQYRPHLILAVKSLPDRRWDEGGKVWLVPTRHKQQVDWFMRKFGFKFVGAQNTQQSDQEVNIPLKEIPTGDDLDLSFMKLQPYPFQRQGIAYGIEKERVIIGDQPGLGKTIQSIGIVSKVDAFPCLVICPSSLKENWRREWENVTGKKAMILTDAVKRNYRLFYEAGLAHVFIVNYESLKKYFVVSIQKPTKWTLKDVNFRPEINMFKSIIIDELHRCKATTTQQSKFTKGITSGKRFVIGLTGTPVVNKPKDLVSQLFIINQMNEVFGNYKHFTDKYCAGTNEASNLKELNATLRNNCFIRREKQTVLKDLPEKQRQVITCEISNRKEYDDAEKDLIKYLKDYKDASDQKIASALRGEIMVKIGILKNISARGKLADVFEFVDDILEAGEKLILFVHLKEVAIAVKTRYHGAVSITGDDDFVSRQISVDRFQKDPKVKLIVCSIKAAGVGLTLTASSRVGFIEFPWTYTDCEQCEDRAHRIGQRDSVMVYYFLGKRTIDSKIYKIIQAKKAIAQAVTGSTEVITENVVDMVANLFNQKDDDE